MQPHGIKYLKEKYGVSNEQIAGAIRAVGNKRTHVEAYLRQATYFGSLLAG
jgi:Protein of unknown function (DUF3606)